MESDGTQSLRVKAHGFRGEDRADYVSVRGGDGHNHNVRVNWVEYLNVQFESNMIVKEKMPKETDEKFPETGGENWQSLFLNKGIDTDNVLQRRSILSALLPNH